MADQKLSRQILALIPQQPPFRFIDDILKADHASITGVCRFREDAFFYQGHFPGNPITPGVILIEAMAQTGVVAMGISALLMQGKTAAEVRKMTTLFAFAEDVEFQGIVFPGDTVIIQGRMNYFRRGNLQARIIMERENGEGVCAGTLTGTGVKLHET